MRWPQGCCGATKISYSAVGVETTIYRKDYPGDEAGQLRKQKEGGANQFILVAKAVHRGKLKDAAVAVG